MGKIDKNQFKPGRCNSPQSRVHHSNNFIDCRVEVIPLSTEAVRNAVERYGTSQTKTNNDNKRIVNNNFKAHKRKDKQKIKWTLEMNIRLIELDEQARKEGHGFMKRLKRLWDNEFPEFQHLSAQNLRDNAARLKNSPDLQELKKVRQREIVKLDNGVEEGVENVDSEDAENIDFRIYMELVREGKVELTEGQKTLLQNELERVKRDCPISGGERRRLLKVKPEPFLMYDADKVLKAHLEEVNSVEELVDSVYAMGRVVMEKMNVKIRKDNGQGKVKCNRQIRKKKDKIKEMRKWIARIGNEIHRGRVGRKMTSRENGLIRELCRMVGKNELKIDDLLREKETRLDNLRYLLASLRKIESIS